MKTKVKCIQKRSDNEFLRFANAASHTNDECAFVMNIKRFRLQSMAKCLVVAIVVNLANLALCNETKTDVKITPSLKYSNDSLSGLASTGVSLENASPLVWSELLEDYILR